MNDNDLFLSEFMKTVDLRLFTPSLYNYFRDYLQLAKVRRFGKHFIINSFLPPFPSAAFDRFLSDFFGKEEKSPVQAADLAVTNGCVFQCWHCYNAGRLLNDLPAETLKRVVRELQELGVTAINFTGGEPCLRHDLVEICSALREDSCGLLSTTGYGFTDEMAERLRETGVYSIAISLDSADEVEHDRKRGVKGAFAIAMKGIEMAKRWGFYTYTVAVPTKKLLEEQNFRKLVELNENLGVSEIQLLEPMPAGRLAPGKVDFGEAEFEKELRYMAEYNAREGGVIITSFAHMESPDFFGCSAGYSHIYIDGSGEVSPCNLLPVSYGNVVEKSLGEIVGRMQSHFCRPFRNCLARTLGEFFREQLKAGKPARADGVPAIPLPQDEGLPWFFQILSDRKRETAGREEILLGYDSVSTVYDDYWLSVAAGPIEELFEKLEVKSGQRAIDCACGTGYSTAKLAQRVGAAGNVLAIDLSSRMIDRARARIQKIGLSNVEFRIADVLKELENVPEESFDVSILTWLIGYVGCGEIFPLLQRALKPEGHVGFVAHLDRSPVVPIEVFEAIARDNPECLTKAVRFKFPKDAAEVERRLEDAGFQTKWIRQSTFDYVCHTGREVYDHVMKSGAGTTFYYSIRPSHRERLAEEFIDRINRRFEGVARIVIAHEYVVGIASRV